MGFIPKVCKPYRAQTKGKVERFIHYLRHSFYYPLLGQLNTVGLPLDVHTANLHVLTWLNDIANKRIHATTCVSPFERLIEEQAKLSPLSLNYKGICISTLHRPEEKPRHRFETQDTPSFQHNLSVYQILLDQHLEVLI